MSKPDYQFLYMMAIARLCGIRGAVNAAIELGPEYSVKALESLKAQTEEHIEYLESKEKQHEPV